MLPGFRELEMSGRIVTADAMHAQTEAARLTFFRSRS